MAAKPMVVSIRIAAPPERVFERISDLSQHEAFTDHFLVDWEDAGPDHVSVRADLPGPEDRSEIDVVEREAPHRLVEQLTGAGGKRRARSTWTLEPGGEGTTLVTFTTEPQATPASERLMGPLIRRWMRRGNEKSLARLRDLVEGGADGAPSR
ncbi:MAG: SRPBCC family protein [Solirubrobacterales bacterium]|nr:SRPBCC family protein [Solirubrobacterales bacterium]